MDRNEIIKAWERCKKCDMSVLASEEGRKAYLDCKYTTGLYCRQDRLINDTIDLLKEQGETELCDRCGRRRLKSNRSV